MFEDSSISISFLISSLVIGIGATAFMDLWAFILKTFFNISGLNYAMVGRWIGHIASGKITHESIGKSPEISGELAIGWTAHYIIGILFAAILLSITGLNWATSPSLLPAVSMGLITVGFPFLFMQPCFGMGFAASKLPNAHIMQIKSLSAHLSFGVGLYIAALLGSIII